jgi:hypothetical protein
MNIIFTETFGMPKECEPKPASSFIPEWYKQTESYTGKEKKPNGEGMTTGTIKRCMPVFDSITAGYIITTYTDVWVSQKDGLPYYEWPSYEPIQWHSTEQAPIHPAHNGAPYPKWISPWSIQTPPGYSVLFVQPFHRESVFTILPGIVDTGTYTPVVNFPFVLNDIKFEGLIPAGTPMVQVIPFKRESWEMSIGNRENLDKQENARRLLRTKLFDSYKTQFRSIKEYK